jgi:hypothetical protein
MQFWALSLVSKEQKQTALLSLSSSTPLEQQAEQKISTSAPVF